MVDRVLRCYDVLKTAPQHPQDDTAGGRKERLDACGVLSTTVCSPQLK
jgi:hypothetical protein